MVDGESCSKSSPVSVCDCDMEAQVWYNVSKACTLAYQE